MPKEQKITSVSKKKKTKNPTSEGWIDRAKENVSDAWDDTKDAVSDAWEKTKNLTENAWDKTKDTAKDAKADWNKNTN